MADKDLKYRILAQVVGAESVDKFNDRLGNLDKNTDKIKSKLTGLSTGIKTLASAFVVTEAVKFTKDLINVADELDELSEKTGIAVKDLSGFQAVAQIEGIAIEELTGNLKKLSIAVVEAAGGNKDYAATFAALGVSVKNPAGQLKNTGSILKEISDKFSGMGDGASKAAIAVKLFGKSGTDFIPFLNKGSQELEKFSLAIDDNFAKRAGAFNDTVTEIGINIKNSFLGGVSQILPTLQEVTTAFTKLNDTGDVANAFVVIGEAVRIATIGFNTFYQISAIAIDYLLANVRVLGNRMMGIFETIGDAVSTRLKQVKALATGNFEEASRLGDMLEKRSTERGKAFAAEREKILDGQEERAKKRVENIAKIYGALSKNSLLLGKGSEDEIKKRQLESTDPGQKSGSSKRFVDPADLGKERDRVKEFIEQQKLENDQRKQALGDINLTQIELLKTTEARKLDADAIKYSKTMTSEQRKELMEATEEIKKQRAEIIQQEFDMKRTYSYGAKEYLREYLNEVTNNATAVKQVFQTTFSSLEDTLVNFVKTGKLNFRNFADSVITELIRISIRQAVLAPIAGALSSALSGAASSGASSGSVQSGYNSAASSSSFKFADGGVMTAKGSIPLKKYSMGGVATSPQLALFGEGRQPEAYVPLPDGRSIPVSMKGGSGDVNVSVNVNVMKDGSSSSDVKSDAKMGKELGQSIVNLIRSEMVNQKRPGGILAT